MASKNKQSSEVDIVNEAGLADESVDPSADVFGEDNNIREPLAAYGY